MGGVGGLGFGGSRAAMFTFQPPATLNQVAPVQNTWYDILPATANCRVYEIVTNIEDADETVQVQVLIDGVTIPANPLASTHSTTYLWYRNPNAVGVALYVRNTSTATSYTQAFLFEGRSVQIQARKTTANGAGNLTGMVVYGVLS